MPIHAEQSLRENLHLLGKSLEVETQQIRDRGWWIERDNGTRIEGPFTTNDDANRCRRWIEIVMKPETFWIRDYS